MIYRKDLIEHLDWLAGSEFLDATIDEAIAAITLTAYGHGKEWIQCGAWMTAEHVVARLGVEDLVERLEATKF